jgi:hypothetical protein
MIWGASPIHSELLERFTPTLRRLSSPVRLTKELIDAFTIEREGAIRVLWGPFGYMPRRPRVVLVGITPGRVQAERALSAFVDALGEGLSLDEAVQRVKASASFGGPLRSNLIMMLDRIGLQDALGLDTCADLFLPGAGTVHFTSVLHFPVFVNCANYSGTPDFLRTRMLRDWIDATLAEDARQLPNALWIPLGPKPAKALRYLAERGLIAPSRILYGLPHPSGANGERIAFFLGRKARTALSRKTSPVTIEIAREQLYKQVKQFANSDV